MTIRQMYEYALIESNKLKAPSMLIEDYIYLLNKAIQQYINLVYNRAEYNQQSSDDLSFLQTTHEIKVGKIAPKVTDNDTIWTLELPSDYVHMLNCIATFTGGSDGRAKRCSGSEDKSKVISSLCRRLTADIYPDVLRNYYLRPSHKNPYWYIINKNNNDFVVTNEKQDDEVLSGSKYKLTDTLENDSSSMDYRYIYMKDRGDRTAHQSTVNIEIHSGKSDWVLDKIYITYIKAPMYVSMTEDEVLAIDDNTQNLEFPDYVCYEIINILVKLIMENASDPRLQTNMPVNQTIAIPGSK